MDAKLNIPSGGMYQEWMSLIDLVEEDTAKKLEMLAANDGWREVQPKEALDIWASKNLLIGLILKLICLC
jgi:hypothetical protein